MVTAFGSIELAVDAMKAGARDFLKKPLTPALLRDALLAALSKGSRHPKRRSPRLRFSLPHPQAGSNEVWTVNGFFIRALPSEERRRAPNIASWSGMRPRTAGRSPGGDQHGRDARIAKLSGRPLPPGRVFWQQQAERALMNHMFREAALPPSNRLNIERVDDEAVLQARDWDRTLAAARPLLLTG